MMFKFLTDSIDNALGVAADTADFVFGDGDVPSRRNVAKLIADGLTVAAIAQGFGVAETVIEEFLEDE